MSRSLNTTVVHYWLLLACLLLLPMQLVQAAPVLLNDQDKDPSISLSANQLGAVFSEYSHRAVRSTIAIQPESGFYYYEGQRQVSAGNFGFGVGTATAPLNNFGGYTEQSIGINTLGYIYYNNASQLNGNGNADILASDTYGIAVDYRSTNPTVYIIVNHQVFYTHSLDQVSDELFIFVYGNRTTSETQQTINAGDDLESMPFVYDAASILTTAAIDGSNQLINGWQDIARTQVFVDGGNITQNVNSTATLTASASNAAGDNISDSISWLDSITGLTGLGPNFELTSTTLATHTVTASVLDELSQVVETSITVTFIDPDIDGDGLSDTEETALGTDVNNSDTDNDGLTDGDEVNNYLTNPLAPDTDNDGLQDGYEITNGFDPLNNSDADIDSDSDGYSNLDEQVAGTDPNNPSSYPGAAAATSLNELDKHDSITLSDDGFGAEFSLSGHHGVRSNVSVEAGSGFYYFEGHREVPAGNFGFGVATDTASLSTYGGASDQSIGINTLGYLFYNNSNTITSDNTDVLASEYYGIAVDYRGNNPVVHTIVNDVLVHTQVMASVNTPLYILVYGNNVAEGIQQTINTATSAFHYDYTAILNSAGITGADQILAGWTPPPPTTAVAISTQTQQIEVNQNLTLSAFAENAAGNDISNTIEWTDSASDQTATGNQFNFTADSLGLHIITAQVLNEQSLPVTSSLSITVIAADTDNDGLTDDQEIALGTDINNADTDADGISDGLEINTYNSDPLQADSDGDGVIDGIEVEIGSNLLTADSDQDSDGDGFSNIEEITQQTNPGNRFSYPGGPESTILNENDGHHSIVLGASGLGITFTDNAVRSIRSTVAIEPGSGWFYYEGHRETDKGNYGFAVATALSSTDEGIANNGQSIGLTTDGTVQFNGVVVETFSDAPENEHYGVAVDYTGSSPTVYFIVTGDDGYRSVLTPRALPDVTTSLHISVFGATLSGQVQATINAGDDPVNKPFKYPAHYELFSNGFAGAEFMGFGWGALHSYNERQNAAEQQEVIFSLNENSGAGIQLSEDGLSAAYEIDLKMGVRSNQGMIGQFRYFEGLRLVENIVKLGDGEGLGIGYGLITEYGRINPYPFDPEQPSMSLNSVAGIWRNLNFIEDFDTSTHHHGFAVDYRGTRPIVHVIVNDDVIHTMTLPDVFTPLFPLIYGNTQGSGVFANAANFGATPFEYDPKDALQRANIDTNGFISGWGAVNSDLDADNLRDSDELLYGSNPLDDDSDGDGLRDGDEVHQFLTSPVNDDSDGDGMPDGYEILLGQNALIDDRHSDIDNNGTDNISEYLAGTSLLDLAPDVSIHQGDRTIQIGESISFSATAADINDGDLKANLQWSIEGSSEITTGPIFTLTLSEGTYRINAQVTDSSSFTSQDSIMLVIVDPETVDTDNDGLSDEDEATYGSNPAIYDTDGDTLSDGEEVNLHNTDPTTSDSDSDGMSDGFEVTYNLDPNDPADSSLDPDNDGRTNLEESLTGTDPNVANSAPATEIIIDNEDSAASIISGNFVTYGAQEQYGTSATYTSAGNTVDRFRFTPAIESAGFYEVFAWNSCYNNRATDVRHIIVHADGTDVIEVDQDCDTGSHGEWLPLGIYRFNLGSSGYLEITDAGIETAENLYMGADAARFLLTDSNAAPVISVNTTALTLLVGQTANLTATASDIEDGDVTASISWTDGDANTATGPNFTYIPAIGSHLITATSNDSSGKTSVVSVTIDVVADDNDGLTPEQENILGTNPADPDTDNDGLNDGDEVNTYGSNPLDNDTDADGLDDAFEVNNGLNPNDASDASGDADADGISNLEEYLNGTDPQTAEAVEIIIINGDQQTSFVGDWSTYSGNESYQGQSLWAAVGNGEDRYRFTPQINQAGNYEVFVWNSCYSDRATNVRHIVNHADGSDTIEVDQDCDTGTHGEWFSLGSYNFIAGTDAYLEITDSGLTQTTYMGADAARFVLDNSNSSPVISTNNSAQTIVFGESISLVASANDNEEGDISAVINWSNDLTSDAATGTSFIFTPALGINTITASVTDLEGLQSNVVITVTVVNSLNDLDNDNDGLNNGDEATFGTDIDNSDTDNDGLSDGDEVHVHGTNPLSIDSDSDLIPDNYEVNNNLNPLDSSDANADADNDGMSNLEEYQQGTDPNVAPVIDIIINNGESGTSSVGSWNDFNGNESYDSNSLWASVGGAIDRYRFTPDIDSTGNYEILVWNSCYNNRATDVPHIIQHQNGQTTVAVDQDCDTGSHGEWFSLGIYGLLAGSGNYLEITDDGIVSLTDTYLGADAVRFIRQ